MKQCHQLQLMIPGHTSPQKSCKHWICVFTSWCTSSPPHRQYSGQFRILDSRHVFHNSHSDTVWLTGCHFFFCACAATLDFQSTGSAKRVWDFPSATKQPNEDYERLGREFFNFHFPVIHSEFSSVSHPCTLQNIATEDLTLKIHTWSSGQNIGAACRPQPV